MKILLATGIYPPDAGGPATYTRAVARAALLLGHDVQVVAYGEKDGIDHVEGYPVERVGRTRNVFARYWKFADAVRRRARLCDVVYLQGPVSEGLPGMIGAMIARKKTVMKVVGDYAWEMYRQGGSGQSAVGSRQRNELLNEFLMHRHGGLIRVLEWIERWTAKRAKRVIVPSRYLASVVKAWGVADDRVRVVYNAAEPLPEGKTREEMRRESGLEGKRVLLTAVRCVPWKGVDFIIGIMPDLPSDVVFAVAGDGPSLDEWKKLAFERRVADHVRFLGRLDKPTLADWYRAADLFVLPSGYEGFPHVVTEAASVGLSSFVSDQGGNPETRELLGDALVRVLPYGDAGAWRVALSDSWPGRAAPAAPETLQFEVMMEKTIGVIREIV
ncbi:MAG TPA: glycosyltransferase family 4 protein [Candidatus Methylomirabilis sp.]|nr:glycosyltransferase family 4 protein [Candidatus Methylomirabilis sp.]